MTAPRRLLMATALVVLFGGQVLPSSGISTATAAPTPGDIVGAPNLNGADDTQVMADGGVYKCGGEPATIVGTSGDDILVGTRAKDVIVGLGGDDVISGGKGADKICGGAGNDTINGNRGGDKIYGQAGADILGGNRGADLIYGGKGRDVVGGGNGADTIDGRKGADTLVGGRARDTVIGGSGRDMLRGKAGNDALMGGIGVDSCYGGLGIDTATTCETTSSVLLKGLLLERWNGIAGTAVTSLTTNQDYPDNPDLETPWLGDLEFNEGQNTGDRLRTYVVPAVTDDYNFWIASDNQSELFLSADANPTNLLNGGLPIARVPFWTGIREWDKYSEQMSASYRLEAGRVYYLEALHKNDGGGPGNFAVAWSWAGDSSIVLIDASRLGMWGDAGHAGPPGSAGRWGVIGMSNTGQIREGYTRVTGDNETFWPVTRNPGVGDPWHIGGGSIEQWANPTSRYWEVFDLGMSLFVPDAIWFNIGVGMQTTDADALAQVQATIATARDRGFDGPIYVTSMPQFVSEGTPAISNSYTKRRLTSERVMEDAIALGWVLRGVEFAPYGDDEMEPGDFPHFSVLGSDRSGQDLADWLAAGQS